MQPKMFLGLSSQEWVAVGLHAIVAVTQIVLTSIHVENPQLALGIQTVLLFLGKIVF